MGLFSKRHKKVLSSDEIAFVLLGLSGESVKAATKALKSHLDSPDIIWRNIEAELLCFSWFSTDYWMFDLVHPAEKSKALRLAFHNHCQNVLRSSEERSALKERMNNYGQLAISHLSEEILYIRFGEKLAEYCGQPEPSFYFTLLAPDLFNQAMTGVDEITRVQNQKSIETKACPHCGKAIVIDVLKCPDCGEFAQKCVNHPERQAVDACVECGKFLCRECSGEGEGDTYCPDCFSGLPEDS